MTAPIIKVVMTGPTGTGKTSLLAAMYPHLETQFPGGDYELLPDRNTRILLDELRDKLSQLGEGGIVVKDKRITGSAQSDEFNFALQYEEDNGTKSTELSLKVFDIPGACGNTYIVNVTPDIAKAWLDSNNFNRPRNAETVAGYVRLISEGHWRLTHQGIAFTEDGILLDGQHRLFAIAESGVTVPLAGEENARTT